MSNKTYILAAGGTSGHINPAIAIADEIKRREPDSRIVFCGTKNGMENIIVPKHHYELTPIDAMGFPNRLSLQLFQAVAAFFRGRKQSRELLRKIRPDAVIGTGGYVCGPMVSMASSLGIPTLLHEQNAFPGKANRFLSRHASVVCISFPGTRDAFVKAKKVVLTGNPVRAEFFNLTKEDARQKLGIGPDEKILFATGGSLGAKTINETVMEMIRHHETLPFRVILACGRLAYPQLVEEAKKYQSGLDLKEYLFDQHLYLAAADVVLSRAGALACSETALIGKASIMVPYPYAAGDHQTLNAMVFSDIGAAIRVADDDLNESWLYEQVCSLLDHPDQITSMETLARTLAMPDASARICDEIFGLVQAKQTS